MNNPLSGPLLTPDLYSLFQQYQDVMFSTLNCHQLGKIVSFNPTNQTAKVQIQAMRVVGDSVQPYPPLDNCPVQFPSGGGARLTFPVAAGDSCLVLFNDRDFDNWFTTGNIAAPNTSRLHDFSDGLVLMGFNGLASPIANFSTTSTELIYKSGKISVDDFIGISNNNATAKTLFTNLITAMKAFTTTAGQTANPATLTAFTAVQAQFDLLFKV